MSGIVTIPVLDFDKTLFTANFSNEENINIKYDVRKMYYYLLGTRYSVILTDRFYIRATAIKSVRCLDLGD